MKPVFPPITKKDAALSVISPAGRVQPEQLEAGLAYVREQGFKPVLGKHVYTDFECGYPYAGTEEERLQDVQHAFDTKETSAIWASRGGYGCMHLLQKLNPEKILENPKWFIGYSDNTALQSWLLKHGIVSVHGQTLKTADFGVSPESYDLIVEIMQGKLPRYTVESHQLNRQGDATGILVGGNLALIYALLGTPYSFDFKGNILFIEEIGERFYALDRMLMALELAGVFTQISGLIIGGLTEMGKAGENAAYEESFDPFANQLIASRIAQYDFPVAFGFPNGHIYDNRPLIIGGEVELHVQSSVHLNFIK